MTTIFRRHFTAVHLLLITAIALIAMETLNALTGDELTNGPIEPERTAVAPVQEPNEPLHLTDVARVLGLALPDTQKPESTASITSSEMPRSGLPLKLLGTLVSQAPGWSAAALQNVTTGRSLTAMVGDSLELAEVLEIERTRVVVLNHGRREFIDGSPGIFPLKTSAPPVATAALIRGTGPNSFEVSRSDIERALSNPADLATQARFMPAFRDGAMSGFKVTAIRADSIYTRAGIESGDVITRINGYDVKSLEKLGELVMQLKTLTRVDVEFERNGTALRKSFAVQ